MTRIDKSDAQLDAEAAAPYDLAASIALHRALWTDDCRIPRLVSRTPPIVTEEGERRAQYSHTGMPTSGQLHRRIFEQQPGEAFPWVSAFRALRMNCRRNHRLTHVGADRPYWRGSLCQEVVRLVIIGMRRPDGRSGPLSPDEAAAVLRLEYGLAELLRDTFTFMEQHIDWLQARAEQRRKHDSGVFRVGETVEPIKHHAVGGLHALECQHPECVARRAA